MALGILGLVIPLIAPFVYGYSLQAEHDIKNSSGLFSPAAKFFVSTAKKCGLTGMVILAVYLLFGGLTLLTYISDLSPL